MPPAAGVPQVTWRNSLNGAVGTATGTTNWSAGLGLLPGDNVITVNAVDGAGRQANDVLTVTYTAPAQAPTPSLSLGGKLYASGRWMKAYLTWSGNVQGRYIDVYLNGSQVTRTWNDGSTTESLRGSGPFKYYVCVAGTNVCSNTVTLQ